MRVKWLMCEKWLKKTLLSTKAIKVMRNNNMRL